MRLAFTGDVSFHGETRGDVFGKVVPKLACKVVVNLESPFVESAGTHAPVREKISISSLAGRIELLDVLRPAAICLANNHIGDYGNEVGRQTIRLCGSRYPTLGAKGDNAQLPVVGNRRRSRRRGGLPWRVGRRVSRTLGRGAHQRYQQRCKQHSTNKPARACASISCHCNLPADFTAI